MAFEDIDLDGDKDIIAGTWDGNLLLYKNDGNLYNPLFTSQSERLLPDEGLSDLNIYIEFPHNVRPNFGSSFTAPTLEFTAGNTTRSAKFEHDYENILIFKYQIKASDMSDNFSNLTDFKINLGDGDIIHSDPSQWRSYFMT